MASLTAAELKTAGLRLELSHDLEERYGVLTPSYAMGENILHRLISKAGLTFNKIK